ncbi:MAG: two-component system sensor histidine kinase NtrB [Gemmataceae bacterium]
MGNLSQPLLGRLLALLAGTALIGLLAVRISIAAWTSPLESAGTDSKLSPVWKLETALAAGLLLLTVAACGWIAARARHRDREQARAECRTEIGLLAGGLAHEIRNTLNAMHSQIALLRKHLPADAEPACQRTSLIERAVEELEELVSEFLMFARPTKDELEDVNLPDLIRGVLDFVALDLEQARVTVRTEVDAALPPVYADAAKLRRALLNLVINARQAMPERGTLTVRAWPRERGEILLEVSDTGCGIPPEDRANIFRSFFSTRPGGTGLGLAIVQRTIEDCGGHITFDSEVGRGTTFRIGLLTAERQRLTLGQQHLPRRKEPSPA